MVFGSKSITRSGDFGGYEPLVVEIAKFFRSGKPPVSAETTIELFAFMEAADESKRQGGKPVALEQVMDAARKANAQARQAAVPQNNSRSGEGDPDAGPFDAHRTEIPHTPALWSVRRSRIAKYRTLRRGSVRSGFPAVKSWDGRDQSTRDADNQA